MVNDKSKYPTFARTVPSKSHLSVPIEAILRLYGWSRLAILSGINGESVIARNKMVTVLKEKGFEIPTHESYLLREKTSYYDSFFEKIKNTVRSKSNFKL